MTTFIIIFSIIAALALLCGAGAVMLSARFRKPVSYVGIVLHALLIPGFAYLSVPLSYVLAFFLGSALLRFSIVYFTEKRKGESRDL